MAQAELERAFDMSNGNKLTNSGNRSGNNSKMCQIALENANYRTKSIR